MSRDSESAISGLDYCLLQTEGRFKNKEKELSIEIAKYLKEKTALI